MFSWFQTSLSKTILITHGSIGCIRGRSCRVIDSERDFFWLQKRWTFRLWWTPQTCSFQCNQLDFQSLFIYLSIYPFSLLPFLASLVKLLLEKIYKNLILILMFGFFLVLDGGNLLQITEALDFHFQTAYLSVTYLDQFLTKRYIDVSSNYDLPKCNICLIFHFINLINWLSISFTLFVDSFDCMQAEKNWAIRLLSIACVSLAAKMEECNVPELSKFQLEDCYFFQGKVIQKMELLVLTTLDWNMSIITPFSFLSYFIKKFGNVSNTMQPIFTVIMEGESIINTWMCFLLRMMWVSDVDFLCRVQSNGSQTICCCSSCYIVGIGSNIDHRRCEVENGFDFANWTGEFLFSLKSLLEREHVNVVG